MHHFGAVNQTFKLDPKQYGLRTGSVGVAMRGSVRAMRRKAETWLRQGISPRRLALTLALGFAIGCLPVIGIPTALCFIVAAGLRLNVPAIQAANYAAMPLQVALIFPFVRLGGWMFSPAGKPHLDTVALAHTSATNLIWASGSVAGQALCAWLLFAVPMVALTTVILTALLRRVPLLADAEAGD
jgi:uncharacterized protein (DUF2062 family)